MIPLEEMKRRLHSPCKHRGEVARDSQCACGKVFDCAIHTFCVNGTDTLDYKGCCMCEQYERAEVDLRSTFDRVLVINLKRRPDRLANFKQQITDWPFAEPQLFAAIDGNIVPSYKQGSTCHAGTRGCLRSHAIILEQAINDGVKALLVLEDDLTTEPDYVRKLREFFANVPEDWDQLMLGGQHVGPVTHVRTNVVKCSNTQRTHAYAVRGKMMRDLYVAWMNGDTHCDHIMGPMQSKYNVYAPSEFIFGQAHSKSDINGRVNPQKTWNPPKGDEPILLLHGPREVIEQLREYGVHIGFDRDPATGYDKGLMLAATNVALLRKWCADLQWECVGAKTTLGVWHPKVTIEALRAAWAGEVREVDCSTLSAALDALGKPPRRSRASQALLVFRGSREAVDAGAALGWHLGYWRDPITGRDHGLQNWVKQGKNIATLVPIIQKLVEEASQINNGLAVIWHEDVTVEDVRAASSMLVVESIVHGTVSADELVNEEIRKQCELPSQA